MARTVYEYTLNLEDSMVQYLANDYLTKEGFRQVDYKGEQVWKRGTGMITAPSYIKLNYANGVIHVEAWIKPFLSGEMSIDSGFVGSIPKSAHRKRVTELLDLITQRQPGQAPGTPSPLQAAAAPSQAPWAAQNGAQQPAPAQPGQPPLQQPVPPQPYQGQPAPLRVHDPANKAIASLILGIVSFLGLCSPIVGVICGGLAIGFGNSGRQSSKKGMGTAGFALGIVGLILSIIVWILAIVAQVSLLA